VAQQARNLLMHLEDHADGAKFLIRDGDAKLTAVFGAAFTAIGVRIIKAPVRAPRANAIAERRVASAAASAWNRMLITGKRHLRLVLSEYADHYNTHRPHRTLQQNPLAGRAYIRARRKYPGAAAGPARRLDTRIRPGRIRDTVFRHL
jgi:putative transposase